MDIKDYKEAKEQIKKIQDNLIKDIYNSSIGKIVKFGKYEWYVINKTDNNCTLLSKDIVEEKAYNEEHGSITWEECTLRSWLNNDFYNQFSDVEKSLIVKTHNSNSDNSTYGSEGGNDTDDYIFLLSIDEAKIIDENIRKSSKWWWLRSPGYEQEYATGVQNYGVLDTIGKYVNFKEENGVRPALIISFEGE